MLRKFECKGLKKRYLEEEKTSILNSLRTVCKGNIAAAAKLHACPPSTIRAWISYPNMSFRHWLHNSVRAIYRTNIE